MLVSLTFRQVREAGLFAWRSDHYLYTPSLDAILLTGTGPFTEKEPKGRFDVRIGELSGGDAEMRLGWHHLRECRCVHCREGRLHLASED